MVHSRLQLYNAFKTKVLGSNPNSTSNRLCGLLFLFQNLPKGCDSGIFGEMFLLLSSEAQMASFAILHLLHWAFRQHALNRVIFGIIGGRPE